MNSARNSGLVGLLVALLWSLGWPGTVGAQSRGLLCQTRKILSTTPLGDVPNDLALSGDTVFVADRSQGLLTFDISDPESPQLLSTLPLADGAYAVQVVGSYAVVGGSLDLHVIDIANPASPTVVGTLALPGKAERVTIFDGIAYIPVNNAGLVIADITGPDNPTLLDVFDPGHSVHNVAIANGSAFLALGVYGMSVVDVTDPGDPFQIGSLDSPRVYDISIAGDVAFVSTRDLSSSRYGVASIDITDPSEPHLLATSDPIAGRSNLVVSDGLAFLNGASAVYDISDPESIIPIGESPTAGRRAAIRGDLAFVVTDDSLSVMNVSDPGPGGPVGFFAIRDSEGLAVRGDYAFLSAWSDGFVVLNISDPHNPLHIASIDLPSLAHHLDIDGDYAYVAVSSRGLAVVDISDPESPELLVPPAGFSGNRVDVGDGVAAVIGTSLYFVDVSDPLLPTLLATHPFGSGGRNHGAVQVTNGHVFLATGALRVFDLSDPQADPVATLEEWPLLNAIDVQGDLACVAGYHDLVMLDVTDPSDPQTIGRMDLPGDTAQSVRLVGDRAYVGLTNRGFWVIDVSDPFAPVLSAATDNWVENRPIFDLNIRGQHATMVSFDGLRVLDISDCPCPADFNNDNTADSRDIIAFLNAWAAQRGTDCSGGCSADFTGDGLVDSRDFIAFLNAWNAGC